MTDAEINAEVARRLGWTYKSTYEGKKMGWKPGTPKKVLEAERNTIQNVGKYYGELPDYLNSCCACKEIKAWLKSEEMVDLTGFEYELTIRHDWRTFKDTSQCQCRIDKYTAGCIEPDDYFEEWSGTEERALCMAFLKATEDIK